MPWRGTRYRTPKFVTKSVQAVKKFLDYVCMYIIDVIPTKDENLVVKSILK
jgi:hypothetical protein